MSHMPGYVERAERAKCAAKEAFLSEACARNAAVLLGVKFPDSEQMRAYRCPWCPDWHLTSRHDPTRVT